MLFKIPKDGSNLKTGLDTPVMCNDLQVGKVVDEDDDYYYIDANIELIPMGGKSLSSGTERPEMSISFTATEKEFADVDDKVKDIMKRILTNHLDK